MYFYEPASCKDGVMPVGDPIGANRMAKSPPVDGWRWLGEAKQHPVFWWQYMRAENWNWMMIQGQVEVQHHSFAR